MSFGTSCEVKFVHGPFDGHRQHLTFPERELAPIVAVPVNRFILQLASDEPTTGDQSMTSVAFYELDESGDDVRYRFLGAVSPEATDIEARVSEFRSHQE